MNSTKYFLLAIIFLSSVFLSCNNHNNIKDASSSNDNKEQTLTTDKIVPAAQSQQNEQQTKNDKIIEYTVKINKVFDHDPKAYTQGLIYYNGELYESTGLNGYSTLRKVNLQSGMVLKEYKLSSQYFAEGIAINNNKIYQLTWISKTCFVYDLKTFELETSFSYYGQGWGMTNYEQMLVMSDGSADLRIIDPNNFEVLSTLSITDENGPVYNLNELELINGDIWANIWQEDRIVIIDPVSGKVKARISLKPIRDYLKPGDYPDVLNGIAYDAKTEKIFLTGKLWKYMFEVELEVLRSVDK